jgi:hypothetical protein
MNGSRSAARLRRPEPPGISCWKMDSAPGEKEISACMRGCSCWECMVELKTARTFTCACVGERVASLALLRQFPEPGTAFQVGTICCSDSVTGFQGWTPLPTLEDVTCGCDSAVTTFPNMLEKYSELGESTQPPCCFCGAAATLESTCIRGFRLDGN